MLAFRPAIFSAFNDYRRSDFLRDLSAGLTVGIIALPLAIGFGIASGVTPQQGLWTGIVAGLAVAFLGGSRFQVAGPTGAFVPVLFATVAKYGYGGLAVAVMMAGVMLVVLGALKMGRLLKFFPYPVVAGFTSGIAVIIFCGQLNEFLGLGLKLPEHVPQQIGLITQHLADVNWYAVMVGALSAGIIYLWPRFNRRVPASIVAVTATALVVYFGDWPVATIGSTFGSIPAGFPGWHLPAISLETLRELMGPAFTIAALGAIESLLSAMVADGMAETHHDPNQELIGQGIANILCPLVGGIAATGAIARTAANIRNGARTPLAAIVHSLVLLLVALAATSVVAFVPLAALSAILISVAIRMAEAHTFIELWRGPRSDFAVMTAAFGLTVVFDLTIGVAAGMFMAVVLFLRQMEADVERLNRARGFGRSLRVRGVRHQRRRGDDAVLVRTQDPARDAGGVAEIVRIDDQLHCRGLSSDTSRLRRTFQSFASRRARAASSSIPATSRTMRTARSRSFAFVARRSTMRSPRVRPDRIIAAVDSMLRTSLVAVPALRRLEPATISGPQQSFACAIASSHVRTSRRRLSSSRSPPQCGLSASKSPMVAPTHAPRISCESISKQGRGARRRSWRPSDRKSILLGICRGAGCR